MNGVTHRFQLDSGYPLGQEAVDHVNDILFRHQLDEATAAAKITESISEIQRGLEKSNQIQLGLKSTIDETEVPTDRVLVRVYFAEQASIENVTQLKEWSQIWYDIARGIAMGHKMAPEEVRVAGAGKGSLFIDLVTVTSVVGTISFIAEKALKITERIYALVHKYR